MCISHLIVWFHWVGFCILLCQSLENRFRNRQNCPGTGVQKPSLPVIQDSMSVGKEMLMLNSPWGVSPTSPSPLWTLGPFLQVTLGFGGSFKGHRGVCLSVHPWGEEAEQGVDALEQHMEGAHSQSVFSCWEKKAVKCDSHHPSPLGSHYIKLGILPLAQSKT